MDRERSREPGRHQSRGHPAQPCMDRSAGSDPRGDRTGAIQNVVHRERKVSEGVTGSVGSSDDRERAARRAENHQHLMYLLHLFHIWQ